jgi:hypothetical protein
MERLTLVSALLLLGSACRPALHPPSGGGWVYVSTGFNLGCAAHRDGRVVCWGRTQVDEPELGPLGARGWRQLDVGASEEVCGVDDAGLVTCDDLLGEVGPSTPFEGGSRQVVIEGRLVCRLGVDGVVACQGTPGLGGESPVAAEALEVVSGSVSLTLSETTLCGLSAEGQGRCVRVDGGVDEVAPATFLAGPWTGLSAGPEVVCGTTMDGQVSCSGDAGLVGAAWVVELSAVQPGVGCVLRPNGRPVCVGGPRQDDVPDVALSQVSVGGLDVCGITEGAGELVCWYVGLSRSSG